jgi:hypothetical protein
MGTMITNFELIISTRSRHAKRETKTSVRKTPLREQLSPTFYTPVISRPRVFWANWKAMASYWLFYSSPPQPYPDRKSPIVAVFLHYRTDFMLEKRDLGILSSTMVAWPSLDV